MTPAVKTSAREVRRLQTRQRILGAAIAEFKRSGMANADMSAIVAAAGVAHGTFYFHFPSKEHVLLELEHREEGRLETEFARFLARLHDLASALTEVVRLVPGLKQRLGRTLFKELLALHFSRTQPDEWTDHPVIVLLVRKIERARGEGGVQAANPFVSNPSTWRSDYGLSLGDPSLRRCLGWHDPDHLVLVLDILQHRHVLSGACRPVARGAHHG